MDLKVPRDRTSTFDPHIVPKGTRRRDGIDAPVISVYAREAASDRKQATKDLYATLARTHLVPTVGTIPLGRLRPSDVEALVVTKRDAGLSASTVRAIYTVLRAALDIASRDGLIRSNPATAVRRPGVERKDAPN